MRGLFAEDVSDIRVEGSTGQKYQWLTRGEEEGMGRHGGQAGERHDIRDAV